MTLGRLSMVLVVVAPALLAGCAQTAEQLAEAAVDAAGCVDLAAAQSQGNAFQYAGAVSCKTGSETFEWSNRAPYARVQWGGAVAEGSIVVRVFDGLDREVYAFELGPDSSAEAADGRTAAGFPAAPPLTSAWRIEIEFTQFTGTVGLQLFSEAPPAATPERLALAPRL